jgi:hypothetical protein
MRRRSRASLTECLSVLFMIAAVGAPRADAGFAGGTGQPNDPYQIATAEQLIAVGSDPNMLNKHFVLVADIDLDPNLPGRRVFTQAVIAAPRGDPNDLERLFFTGTLDGQNHMIKNLTIHVNKGEWQGLFGEIGEGGRVCSLALDGVTIRNGRRAGALAGWNTGTIDRCSSAGSMHGNWMVGGLVGQNGGSIDHCYSTARVQGDDKSFDLGGLVGTFMDGQIVDCHSTGNVSAGTKSHSIGGLVGNSDALDGTIADCWASGSVSSGQESNGIGGLIGLVMMGGTIKQCYAIGSVLCGDGSRSAGGLVGSFSGSTITDCYATSSVSGGTGTWPIGGFVGSLDAMSAKIANCYAVGKISKGNLKSGFGGLIGEMRNPQWIRVTHCFWDVETAGVSVSAAGEGLTTAQMQDIRTYQTAGWDLAGHTTDGTDDIWYLPPGGGYPLLTALSATYQPRTLRGRGTASDPYLVEMAQDLAIIGRLRTGYFRLTADLDLAGITWSRAPIPEFEGCFDGNGHRIRNLAVRSGEPDRLGLFGDIAGGRVVNLGIENVSITGVDGSTNLGSLAGGTSGQIANCYVTGKITAGKQAHSLGGLVGSNWTGVITNCFASVHISTGKDADQIGGLVAYGYMGTISHSYAAGRISAGENSTFVGGLVAWRSDASDVSRCFWDVESTGASRSDGGIGLTTAQMQDIQTFLNNGWDFLGERSNGTGDTWRMPEGGGYPELAVFWAGYQPHRLSGSGTSDDPYTIATPEDLASIDQYYGAGHYRMAANLDLSGITWTRAPIHTFVGVLDGAGFSISHLTIHGGNHLGLIGTLGSQAAVQDVSIRDLRIVGQDEAWYVGALAGRSSGRIMGCHATGQVSTGMKSHAVGGLVGEIHAGEITTCSSACTVSAGPHGNGIGGIVGFSLSGKIARCRATASVSGADESNSVGGLVGEAHFWTGISDCYATGSVAGGRKSRGLGGLVGIVSEGDLFPTSGKIVNCYAAGSVKGGEDSTDIGGLLGREAKIQPLTSNCYLLRVSDGGGSENGNGTPLSKEQMKQRASFAGWDFDSIWTISEGKTYPRLRWEENLPVN